MDLKIQKQSNPSLKDIKDSLKGLEQTFIIIDSEDNNEEFVNFYFIGNYLGKEVVFDAVIYTLRLQHESELYEIAEHEAAKRFSSFKRIQYEEDENGDMKVLDGDQEEIGLFMAEIIMELEDEDSVKVQEHVEMDLHIDFGIGLDIGLNVETITDDVITRFVNEFNENSLTLDKTWYSFQIEND